jgi:hypothetical protein
MSVRGCVVAGGSGCGSGATEPLAGGLTANLGHGLFRGRVLCNRFCGSVSVWVAFLAFSATRNPSWELGPALAGLFRASVFLCCATNAAAWRC